MEYSSPKDGGLLFTAAFLCSSVALASPVPVVRVMVERERHAIKVEGFDLDVHEADSNRKIGGKNGRAAIPIQCSLGAKLRIDLGGQVIRASGPLHITSLGGFIRVGQSQYRDDLYVYSFNGDCMVVNHVDLEKYVAGLLNSEMSSQWSLPTLMAQAVAARTYAIYQMKESSTVGFKALRPPFDLEATVRDQVYHGAHQERYRTLKAVQATRGQVLMYDSKPIKAFYHSTCGGRTETAERVWGARYAYSKSVKCGFCDRSPRFNWRYSTSLEALEKKLAHQNLLKGALVGVQVLERNTLGRAKTLSVQGTMGDMVMSAKMMRDLLGTLNVWSTDFTITKNTEGLTFTGHGSGHGVGMCQWGAKFMGEHGFSHSEILKRYYPKAELVKLY